ncbi:MAG: FAD-dependent oxidoreductase [Rhodothermales bacterium]|nr:FAD-dependent oxidoreductase [Rhodothermales bacterium]MBO6781635.1 FAD-dependent oxidoreductase [Rhodothermales bacterium]
MRITVIGGGLMGLCATRSLLERGAEVQLVDAALPAASRDYHRLIRVTYGGLSGYGKMAREALHAWRRLTMGSGQTLFHPSGILLAGPPGSPWVESSLAGLDPAECSPEDGPQEWDLAHRSRYRIATGGMLFANRILDYLYDSLVGEVVHGLAVEVDPFSGTTWLKSGQVLKADRVLVATGHHEWPSGSPGRHTRRSRQPVAYLDGPDRADLPVILDLSEPDGFYFFPPVAGLPGKFGSHAFGPPGDGTTVITVQERSDLNALLEARGLASTPYTVSGFGMCHYDVSEDERFIAQFAGRGLWLSGFSGHGFKFGPLIGDRVAACLLGDLDEPAFSEWFAGRS